MNPRQITVSGGNLFQIAAQYLNSAEDWNLIASLNGLTDPFITGTVTLTLPSSTAGANGGIRFA